MPAKYPNEYTQDPNPTGLKLQYLELCEKTGVTPRSCVDKYTDEHFQLFIKILSGT